LRKIREIFLIKRYSGVQKFVSETTQDIQGRKKWFLKKMGAALPAFPVCNEGEPNFLGHCFQHPWSNLMYIL
jgi:hypothetical protein